MRWAEATAPLQSGRAGSLLTIHDRRQWDESIRSFADANYRQTWTYGHVSAGRYRAKIERVAIQCGSELIGLASVRIKSIPLVHTGIAYIGGGPLTRRGAEQDPSALVLCLQALREEYLHRRGYLLRILPPVVPFGDATAIDQAFRAAGFETSPWPPPYRTIVVNLDRPLPDIRKSLAQKWRNGLNKAERQSLTVVSGAGPELFDAFHVLFEQFIDRKHISVDLAADFFRAVRNQSVGDDGYLVSLALKDGVPIAGHLASLLGDTAVYLQGATGEKALKTNAAYLLQWHALCAAKQRGVKWYELGGIEPEAMPGVYHFKCGFNGTEAGSPGPFQAAPTGMRGSLVPNVERFYRWTVRRAHRAKSA